MREPICFFPSCDNPFNTYFGPIINLLKIHLKDMFMANAQNNKVERKNFKFAKSGAFPLYPTS